MDFTTELLATAGTATGFEVPDDVVDRLGGGRRPQGGGHRSGAHLAHQHRLDGRAVPARRQRGGARSRGHRQPAEAVLAAKKPETRERRVAGIIDTLR